MLKVGLLFMLFVSRLIGSNYGVADTEDGVEEKVDAMRLHNYVIDLNIPIAGVIPSDDENVFPVISVYQPLETMTQLQVKTEMLLGVSVKVYKDAISSISWDCKRISKPVAIRLSDFAKGCHDGILVNSGVKAYRHILTLILDDKVDFTMRSFRVPFGGNLGENGLGIIFNVKELTDASRVKLLYDIMFRYSDDPDIYKTIIDSPERMRAMVDSHYGIVR